MKSLNWLDCGLQGKAWISENSTVAGTTCHNRFMTGNIALKCTIPIRRIYKGIPSYKALTDKEKETEVERPILRDEETRPRPRIRFTSGKHFCWAERSFRNIAGGKQKRDNSSLKYVDIEQFIQQLKHKSEALIKLLGMNNGKSAEFEALVFQGPWERDVKEKLPD